MWLKREHYSLTKTSSPKKGFCSQNVVSKGVLSSNDISFTSKGRRAKVAVECITGVTKAARVYSQQNTRKYYAVCKPKMHKCITQKKLNFQRARAQRKTLTSTFCTENFGDITAALHVLGVAKQRINATFSPPFTTHRWEAAITAANFSLKG